MRRRPSAAQAFRRRYVYTEGGKLYGLAFNAGQREVLRANFDGEDVRVLGRAKAKQPGYWAQPSRPPQLTVEGGLSISANRAL